MVWLTEGPKQKQSESLPYLGGRDRPIEDLKD